MNKTLKRILGILSIIAIFYLTFYLCNEVLPNPFYEGNWWATPTALLIIIFSIYCIGLIASFSEMVE